MRMLGIPLVLIQEMNTKFGIREFLHGEALPEIMHEHGNIIQLFREARLGRTVR